MIDEHVYKSKAFLGKPELKVRFIAGYSHYLPALTGKVFHQGKSEVEQRESSIGDENCLAAHEHDPLWFEPISSGEFLYCSEGRLLSHTDKSSFRYLPSRSISSFK